MSVATCQTCGQPVEAGYTLCPSCELDFALLLDQYVPWTHALEDSLDATLHPGGHQPTRIITPTAPTPLRLDVLDHLDRVATRFGVIANGTMVREMTADQVQAECGDTLRVRTADPARTLALLEEALPHATFRAEPDGSLAVAGADQAGVAQVLRVADQLVLELSEVKRDIEDYFVELMEGGARAKAGAARLGEEGMPAETPAVSNGKGGAHHA